MVASIFFLGVGGGGLQLLGSNVSTHSHFLHKITLFERGQTASLITTEIM